MCLFVDGGLGQGKAVLQLGLGVGTAVTFLRQQNVRVDVVELNPRVVEVAASDFGFNKNPGPHGTTFIEDAHAFLSARQEQDTSSPAGTQQPPPPQHQHQHQQRYTVVLHDVFVGYNPFPLFSKEIFTAIRDRWLTTDGMLLLNFVGHHTGGDDKGRAAAHRLTAAVLRTLQSVFGSVRCYRV